MLFHNITTDFHAPCSLAMHFEKHFIIVIAIIINFFRSGRQINTFESSHRKTKSTAIVFSQRVKNLHCTQIKINMSLFRNRSVFTAGWNFSFRLVQTWSFKAISLHSFHILILQDVHTQSLFCSLRFEKSYYLIRYILYCKPICSLCDHRASCTHPNSLTHF